MSAHHRKNIPIKTSAITAARVDHLPIIAQYLRQLHLVEIVNELVPLKMAVEPGIIVLGVVLDTLSGRSPLYHLEKAFEDCDQELLFGRDLPPGYFNIEVLGLMLLISLLVWRLIEHTMRTELEVDDSTLSGWDNKPIQ